MIIVLLNIYDFASEVGDSAISTINQFYSVWFGWWFKPFV